jgi:cyclophilin family peptidyl-prolyl cis-trans isomerase
LATEKRQRKKEARDARVAERDAALRRRRVTRVIAVVVTLGVVAVLALTTGNENDDEPGKAEEQPAAAGCGAEPPPEADPQTYDKPKQVTQPGTDYRAVIHTSCGDIQVDLLEEKAPQTVNNFVFLAREGFYDGLTFHRIINEFVVQGGDPEGTGAGGPGYQFEDELPQKPREYVYGVMAMANSGPDTNGSQFFFVVHGDPAEGNFEPAGLNPLYSIFGMADPASFDVLERISTLETKGGGPTAPDAEQPVEPVFIESVEIIEA